MNDHSSVRNKKLTLTREETRAVHERTRENLRRLIEHLNFARDNVHTVTDPDDVLQFEMSSEELLKAAAEIRIGIDNSNARRAQHRVDEALDAATLAQARSARLTSSGRR